MQLKGSAPAPAHSLQRILFLKCIWLCQGLGAAGGILVPVQGLNPGPLHWEHTALATVPPGKSPKWL